MSLPEVQSALLFILLPAKESFLLKGNMEGEAQGRRVCEWNGSEVQEPAAPVVGTGRASQTGRSVRSWASWMS